MRINCTNRSNLRAYLEDPVGYTTTGRAVYLVASDKVAPHEHYDHRCMIAIAVDLISCGTIFIPIVIDSVTGVLLDGHHRFAALRKYLSAPFVPSVAVDYFSDDGVKVSNWRSAEVVTKKDVIKAALTQRLMPVKTSRHIFQQGIGECQLGIKSLYIYKTKAPTKVPIITSETQLTGYQNA